MRDLTRDIHVWLCAGEVGARTEEATRLLKIVGRAEYVWCVLRVHVEPVDIPQL